MTPTPDEIERETMRMRTERAGIPARFASATFESYATDKLPANRLDAKRIVSQYVQNFDRHLSAGDNLLLIGSAGVGKTHLATAAGLILLRAERHVRYDLATDVVRRVRATWSRSSQRTELEVLRNYRELDLLILDELGVGFGTDSERGTLFDVIDGRYRERRPSIFITNEDADGIRGAIGDRCYDRLTEGTTVVLLRGASYRPIAAREARA